MYIGCLCLCMICYHINSFCCGWSTKLMMLLYTIMVWQLSTLLLVYCFLWQDWTTCKQEM
jgi:hypothetical protein